MANTLKDLIKQKPYILDIPSELLECVNWNDVTEEDWKFVDCEDLVDLLLQKDIFTFNFLDSIVLFTKERDKLVIDDRLNGHVLKINISDRLRIFKNIVYYSTLEYYDDKKDFIMSQRDYNLIKNRIEGDINV